MRSAMPTRTTTLRLCACTRRGIVEQGGANAFSCTKKLNVIPVQADLGVRFAKIHGDAGQVVVAAHHLKDQPAHPVEERRSERVLVQWPAVDERAVQLGALPAEQRSYSAGPGQDAVKNPFQTPSSLA